MNLNSEIQYSPSRSDDVNLPAFYRIAKHQKFKAADYGFQKKFPTVTKRAVERCRILLMHDSCLPTHSVTPLVFKDVLAVPVPLATFAEMAVIAANIARLGPNRISLLLLVGGPDFIRRTCSDFDFVKDKPSNFDKERIYGSFVKEIGAIKMLKNRARLPVKVALVSPPCLSDYLEKNQAIIHCMAGIARLFGFPYILTGTDILATKTIVLSGFSRPAVWRFLVSIGQALYSVGVSPFVTLTQSGLLGRDLYEWWHRLVTTQSIKYPHNFLEDPDSHRLYVGNWTMEVNSQNVWDSSLLKEASDDAKRASKTYQKQVVETAQLNYQPSELKRAPGVLNEPPVYANIEDRPRADKPASETNQGIGLLRT